MKITILGSGTAVPSLERNSSGVLIQEEGINTLVDFGYGTLKQLLHLGITYHDIDRIFFTHNHPDHICDLVPFLFGARYRPSARKKDLEIVAGLGFQKFLDQLMSAFKHWLVPTDYQLRITEIDEGSKQFGCHLVHFKKVKHIEMSRGYRFENSAGKSVVLSGDTDYCKDMVELGKKADLLILECAMPDEEKIAGHLVPSLAGKLAQEADCKMLCLTHFYPPCDLDVIRETVSAIYNGELFLAHDLMQFQLSNPPL
jgi:ribonuclease BN (tRNA processing enzyme)